jgi:hypothetical protein
VGSILRFVDHEEAVEQLQALAGLEQPEVHEALVLGATPATGAHDGRGHRAIVTIAF